MSSPIVLMFTRGKALGRAAFPPRCSMEPSSDWRMYCSPTKWWVGIARVSPTQRSKRSPAMACGYPTVRCSRAASTLSRKQVALHPMSRGFSNPEIKRTRRTAPARSGFAFSHRGELAKTELDGSSATGVAKRSTTRMNVTRCRRRLSAASGHRASSKQTCRLQLWLGIVVSSSTSFDDSWLDGAFLDKVRQTMRDASCVRCQLQMFGASFAFLARTSLT